MLFKFSVYAQIVEAIFELHFPRQKNCCSSLKLSKTIAMRLSNQLEIKNLNPDARLAKNMFRER